MHSVFNIIEESRTIEKSGIVKNKHLTDTRTSLFLFLYIWILYAVVCMTKNCFAGAMAAIVNDGIMTKSQTGLITAMFYVVYAILQIFGGKFADKYRPDIIILIGLFGAAGANIIIYFNQNYYVMLTTWTLNAVFQFGIWPAIFKIISSELVRLHRIRGIYYISFSSGFGLCLSFVSGALMTKWQNNFLLSAILLVILSVGLMVIYPLARRKMLEDTEHTQTQKAIEKNTELDINSSTLFKKCGLYIIFPAIVVRGLLDYIKNFTPTLLMESYETVTPVIGNSLNIIITLAGFVGMFLMKFVYPKHISDEFSGLRKFFIVILPFLFFTLLVGKIHISLIVVAISVIIAISSGMYLFVSYFTMKFAKLGKNGEMAGITNASAAIGIVIQSYVLGLVADHAGWTAVLWILIALVALSIILLYIAFPRWRKFLREYGI